ncbi:hypothetical protein PCANC_03094 [Puccinia coronata f. sp. avenae]|uniref:Tet-like 2OG-Fe(II) oxygenase domain-containing protein n=1 Tax=Puccinia coronata f. sp. avenae TaxID=200324 RepID=A0A2N5W4J7_9BASI|nr:hypothetical protein PCANC_03094 [Puccinia coronata f. sp. avenae]
MWADGWCKASKDTKHFGRFCLVDFLRKMMNLLKFNPKNQKACLLKAGKWISSQLRGFALVVHNNYHKLLTINQYPSMNHMEYGEPYTFSDFVSFLTFTMYDSHKTPHMENNFNDWMLVAWIPIFNPKNPGNPQFLANKGFDMIDHKISVIKLFLVLPSLKTSPERSGAIC